MPSPLEHLEAALALAEEGERDENGFLTEAARAVVQAAYGSVGGLSPEEGKSLDDEPAPGDRRVPVPRVKPSPFRYPGIPTEETLFEGPEGEDGPPVP